jgi:hypothetical protein
VREKQRETEVASPSSERPHRWGMLAQAQMHPVSLNAEIPATPVSCMALKQSGQVQMSHLDKNTDHFRRVGTLSCWLSLPSWTGEVLQPESELVIGRFVLVHLDQGQGERSYSFSSPMAWSWCVVTHRIGSFLSRLFLFFKCIEYTPRLSGETNYRPSILKNTTQ